MLTPAGRGKIENVSKPPFKRAKTPLRKLTGSGVAQGLATGALAGIGWKLGLDLYDAIKRKMTAESSRDDSRRSTD